MAKIAYPNKQTAVNPSSPAANEVFTAANANEIKQSVNDLYDLQPTIDNETIDYDSTSLNSAYPSAAIGKQVICPFQSGFGSIIFIKVTSTDWYSYPLAQI